MSAAGKFLAVILALLVANPVCCCTIGTLFGNKTAQALPSCCAAKKAQQQNQSPSRNEQEPPCPCAKNRTALLESKATVAEPHFSAAPALVPSFSVEPIFTPVSTLGESAPSANPPPPPPAWRLHCRYLL